MSIGDVTSKDRGSGARYNSGKARYDLIPIASLKPAADVFEYGAGKYSAHNWLCGQNWTVPLASMLRHIEAFQRGEDLDPESGLPHVGHILCNAVMLSHYYQYFSEGDDRIPSRFFQDE